MKTQLFLLSLLSLLTFDLNAAKHTVSNSGTTFTPAEITINIGDTVVFSIGSMHNAIEVSQETYNSNGNTSNGGFSVALGGGSVSFNSNGTFYYVCEPHASLGMKGIIHVVTPSDIGQTVFDNSFTVFPNPATKDISITYRLKQPSKVEVKIINITGSEILNIFNDYQNAYLHNFTYPFNDEIKPGIYFLILSTAEGELIRKLIIK